MESTTKLVRFQTSATMLPRIVTTPAWYVGLESAILSGSTTLALLPTKARQARHSTGREDRWSWKWPPAARLGNVAKTCEALLALGSATIRD